MRKKVLVMKMMIVESFPIGGMMMGNGRVKTLTLTMRASFM